MKTPGHLLVANPTAQSGKNAARIARVRRMLETLGLEHDFVPTEAGGGTVEAVRHALDGGAYRTAISMGGDGTFAEVAKGILGSRRKAEVRLAMLPTGTANDQGKSFGLASDDGALERNCRVVVAGLETRLDVGSLRALSKAGKTLRRDLFFDSAGWGLSARVLARRNLDRKAVSKVPVLKDLWRDQLVYAGALAKSFLDPSLDLAKFDARVVADGTAVEWRGLLDLVVKGTPVYGGSWVLDRAARPGDGRFEVVPFTGRRDFVSKALAKLDHAKPLEDVLGGLGLEPARGLSAGCIAIELSNGDVEAQIDGEEFPSSARVEIEVLKRALRLVVPQKYADG
ncbi:MAG: hypothetical protein HY553_06955 [Elusimicrobia bacterium]|nr:hypothetical protein [Elusimicrobiota bacterium]